jgi:hypothetical protein
MNLVVQHKNEEAAGQATSRWAWLFLCVCATTWLTFAGNVTPAAAQSTTISREYPLKAAYLYNFGSYVEWPASAFASPQAPFVLGVIGPNPFSDLLDEVASTKKIQGRTIVIRQLATPADATKCQIVFIAGGATEAERLGVIKAARSHPVLTVSESAGLAERGVVVNFFIEQNKIRFEINVQTAREQGLKISSKLLSLARVIGSDGVSRN